MERVVVVDVSSLTKKDWNSALIEMRGRLAVVVASLSCSAACGGKVTVEDGNMAVAAVDAGSRVAPVMGSPGDDGGNDAGLGDGFDAQIETGPAIDGSDADFDAGSRAEDAVAPDSGLSDTKAPDGVLCARFFGPVASCTAPPEAGTVRRCTTAFPTCHKEGVLPSSPWNCCNVMQLSVDEIIAECLPTMSSGCN